MRAVFHEHRCIGQDILILSRAKRESKDHTERVTPPSTRMFWPVM
jgi:hypothetical protein